MNLRTFLRGNIPGKTWGVACTLLLSFAMAVSACGGGDDDAPDINRPVSPDITVSEASKVMDGLWDTSPMLADKDSRTTLYSSIQNWADACPAENVFKKYLVANETTASSLERTYPVLECYNMAFDRTLKALKEGLPIGAKPRVWALFNMGIVVQTEVGNYAVDIYHRRGAELAPYIDFYAITHAYADHKWEPLTVAMSDLKKPVLTNFTINGVNNNQYLSVTSKDYKIGKFDIHSFITHHNGSDLSKLAITAFYIDGGGMKLFHSGDSNFIADEFETMRGKEVDFYVFHYAVNALTENNVLGKVIFPKVAVLSHILELGHKDVSESRWSLQMGLDRAARLDCETVAMPFWGDCLNK